MEHQLFYYTGLFCWYAFALMICLLAVVIAVFLPFYAAHRWKKVIWEWMWAARIADTGYTKEDLIFAYSVPDSPLKGKISQEELVLWLGRVKERARISKNRSSAK